MSVVYNPDISSSSANANGVQGIRISSTAPNDGQALIYNASDSAWEPTNGGVGGVESVTGTAPVAATAGANPVISMHVADSSHNGYLLKDDWSTFNGKAAGGANTDITSMTIPRQGSQRNIKSADQTSANSDPIRFTTGSLSAAPDSGVSGDQTITSGNVSGSGNDTTSGAVFISSGDNTSSGSNPGSGGITISTGAATEGGSRGDVDVEGNSVVVLADGEFGVSSGSVIQFASAQGVQLITTSSRPAASSDTRGTIWFQANGAGVQDTLQICVKTAADAYAWKTVTVS